MNIISIGIFGYIFFRVIFPMRIALGWRLALALPLFLASFKAAILHKLGGDNFFAPDLPGFLLILGGYAFGAVLFFFLLCLFWEIVRGGGLVYFYFRKKFPEKGIRHKWDSRVYLSLFAASLLLAGVGVYHGTRLADIREVSLVLPQLPPQCDGLKIAFLADIHVDRFTGKKKIASIVKKVNSCKADLILLGGDYVDGPVERCGDALRELEDLKAPLGVYGVMGNHEYFSSFDLWKRFFDRLPLKILYNEAVRLPGGLVLCGVTDPIAARFGLEAPDLKKALAGIDPQKELTILLSHRPGTTVREAAGMGVALQLSGHTHGGMLPGLKYIVAKYNKGFVAGQYDVMGMKLFLINGTGIWNGFPLRLFCDPEILLLTLKCPPGK